MSIERLHARIAWLEAAVQQRAGEAIMANDRIEALEAALRSALVQFEFIAGCASISERLKEIRDALDKDAGK